MIEIGAASTNDLEWVINRTGCVPTADMQAMKAVHVDGRIMGMVAYDSWTPNSVQVHMAVAHPIAWRRLLKPAFEYIFNHAKRGIAVAVIRASNLKSIALTERFGFDETHRIANGWAEGEDLVVFEMRRAQCRYLGSA